MARALPTTVALLFDLLATVVPATATADEPTLELDLVWKPPVQDLTTFGGQEVLLTSPGAVRVICEAKRARVELDGTALGECPQSRTDIPAGIHNVTIVLPSGSRFTQHVFVRGGEVATVTVRPSVTGETVSMIVSTVSTVVATAIAVAAGATSSARIGVDKQTPGLITNASALRGDPRLHPGRSP